MKKNRYTSQKKLEVAALGAGCVMVLVLAAVFISSGGMERLTHILAVNNIDGTTQTAVNWGCVFGYDCGNPPSGQAYSIYQIGASSVNVPPGTAVTLTAVAYNFVSDQATFNLWYSWCGFSGSSCTVKASTGGASTTLVTAAPYYCGPYAPSCPDQYLQKTMVVNPTQTTTYMLCSNYYGQINNEEDEEEEQDEDHRGYAYGVTCPKITVTVADACPISSFSSPWNTNSYLIYGGGVGSVSPPGGGRYCVRNYSGAALFNPVATAAEWNSFAARAPAISVGVVAY